MKSYKKFLCIFFALGLLIILIVSTIYIDSGYVYGVYINGYRLALVKNKEVVSRAVNEVKNNIKSKYGLEADVDNHIVIKNLWSKNKLTDYMTLKDNIVKMSSYKVNATAICIDNVPVSYVKNKNEAESIIDKLLEPYKLMKSTNQISDYKIKSSVTLKKTKVDLSKISYPDDVFKLLRDGVKYDRITYLVRNGDTLETIAKALNMDVDTLKKYNAETLQNIKEGQVLKLTKPSPYFAVLTYENTIDTEDIPFKTTIKYDSSVAYGSSVEKQKGQNGKKKVELSIVKENGVKVSENTVKETILKNPVMRILLRGTNRFLATGSFIYPSRGYISSEFGYRWGRIHKGVDIAADYGTGVYSSDAGIIEFAGWEEGYGELIIINHENGYETYYGHLSEIDVTVGQKVSKGAYIGKVGETGDATGPHLHFEVRKDGTPQNPLIYLK